MVTEDLHVREGMDVFGTDGEKIGRVAEVFSADTTEGEAAGYKSPDDVAADERESVADTSQIAELPREGGYFKVDEGGVLGIGAKHLYVPFSAVANVVPDDNVTLDCTKSEAESRFANEPANLRTDSSG